MKFYFRKSALLIVIILLPLFSALRDPSILVSPTIIPSFPQAIGHQVPNGFGPKLLQTTRIYKNFDECPCMTHIPRQCPPCTSNPNTEIYHAILSIQQCECAPKLQCDPCPKLYQAIHEMSLRQVKDSL